jgi:hypothetical protein
MDILEMSFSTLSIKVINLGGNIFGNPIFQKILQN